MALFKNPILEVSQSHNFFWESLYVWGSQEKKLGQKVNVKYFRVDPYTLGNRIPRVFQNLSDLHVRCHREKFKNFTLSFCPKFFWESLYMWGSQEKILGHQVNKKKFRVDPARKKSKKVNEILFLFPFPFPVIPKNGGL